MEKQDLVKILLDDFIKMFPNATREEKFHLSMRLNLMEVSDLELIVSQLKDSEK